MEQWLERIWNPYLLALFLLMGLYCFFWGGFLSLNAPVWWTGTVGQLGKDEKSVKGNTFTQVTGVCTALATTIGTGSIAGVATAIWLGGSGAIFWMWVSGVLGMMLSATEKILTLQYRVSDGQGGYLGGPMYYLERGLGSAFLGKCYGIACLFSTFVGGNMVQSSSIAESLQHLASVPPLLTGSVLTILVMMALAKGMMFVGKVSTVFVPLMAGLYLFSAFFCILQDIPKLILAIGDIFREAFAPMSAVGGVTGYGLQTALRYGMARGIFSNEAGLGAGAIAHANAKVDHPARQGLWGMLEVWFATMVVCTVTGLVILTSGVYQPTVARYVIESSAVPLIPVGVPLTQVAFAITMGNIGSGIVSVSLILFAFTSILGWSCYGLQAMRYLTKNKKWEYTYVLAVGACLLWGSSGNTLTLWQWVDFSIICMAVPNLIGIFFLAPQALTSLKQWVSSEEWKQ